ncbi:ribonuclease E/G [Anaerobacillus sp. HL2]|nr:ribonuclease E/G [Anaerobacillus sp. HL2]
MNTGKFTGKLDLQDTIVKTNIDAAKEIARQLRLRDIVEIIIIDFIDIKKDKDKQKVLQAFQDALKSDRTKTNVLGFTGLGLVEMTRRRFVKTCRIAFLLHAHHVMSKESIIR